MPDANGLGARAFRPRRGAAGTVTAPSLTLPRWGREFGSAPQRGEAGRGDSTLRTVFTSALEEARSLHRTGTPRAAQRNLAFLRSGRARGLPSDMGRQQLSTPCLIKPASLYPRGPERHKKEARCKLFTCLVGARAACPRRRDAGVPPSVWVTPDPHAARAAHRRDEHTIVPGRATPSQTLPPGGGMGKPGFPTPLAEGVSRHGSKPAVCA